jgi:hypothetical protein
VNRRQSFLMALLSTGSSSAVVVPILAIPMQRISLLYFAFCSRTSRQTSQLPNRFPKYGKRSSYQVTLQRPALSSSIEVKTRRPLPYAAFANSAPRFPSSSATRRIRLEAFLMPPWDSGYDGPAAFRHTDSFPFIHLRRPRRPTYVDPDGGGKGAGSCRCHVTTTVGKIRKPFTSNFVTDHSRIVHLSTRSWPCPSRHTP